MKIRKLLKTAGLVAAAAVLSVNVSMAAAYSDVNPGDWYFDSVQYVSDLQIMTGLNETVFGPSEPLARAQFAVILHRMAGNPGASSQSSFTDVAPDMWYASAVAWASEAGIVTGYTDTNTFMPGKSITREEIATMLHRFARYENRESEARGNLNIYPDAFKVSSFSYEAMQWSVAYRLIRGDNGNLNPQGTTNRAECATMIGRYLQNDPDSSLPDTDPELPDGEVTGQAVVDYARQFVGFTPYVLGGNSLITGTDCSGFVKLIYEAFGVTLPRTTWEQDDTGKEIKESEMQPGDLIFFNSYEHVGIYSGNGKFIHTSTKERGTVEDDLRWMGEIKTVRRVLP